MKTIDKIPTGKIERTTTLVKTGVKLGGNYLSYYGRKAIGSDIKRETLDEANAADIYDGLKDLKGSALKVAQMLSMEKSIMPRAYVEQFSLAQFSVPPLSAPLVRKTFKRYTGKNPEDIFENFSKNAVNAASIGQVHRASIDGKQIAVKIQYPGVADAISSDLAMVKPIATRMFNIKAKDAQKYFKEVEGKLLEETDYNLEIERSQFITKACEAIPGLVFPKYYPEYSNGRILVMDWIDGKHLSEFTKESKSQEINNAIGQSLWDFYMYQMHVLKQVHADPHPGNFIVTNEGKLAAIDFGCIKEIPNSFYIPYFQLSQKSTFEDASNLKSRMLQLELLKETDSLAEEAYFMNLFKEMLSLFSEPFQHETFDFGNPDFWNRITALSEKFSKDKDLRKMDANRGSEHFLYINRTFFGLYNLLNDLNANVEIDRLKVFEKSMLAES